MVKVFNFDNPEAHYFFTHVSEDDVLKVSMPCVSRVEVTGAYFRTPYQGTKGIAAPCLHIDGKVNQLFIEDYDDRMFPCGSKLMELLQPEDVSIDYLLYPDEVSLLAQKGLFHDPNFAPPAGLVGNVIEIPCDVTYYGIYDTLVGAVTINDARSMSTDKWLTGYLTLFDLCEQSSRVPMLLNGTISLQSEHQKQDRTAGMPVGYEPVPQETGDYKPVSKMPDSMREDARIAQAVAKGIDDRMQQAASIREAMKHDTTASDMLEAARKEKEKRDKPAYLGENGSAGESRAAKLYDMLKQKVAEAKKPDEARPETPLDGYSRTEEVVKNPLKEKEDDRDRSGKKGVKIAQLVDVAQDNQALNRGETDIAGHGAAAKIASEREQERIAAAEGQAPTEKRSADPERYL